MDKPKPVAKGVDEFCRAISRMANAVFCRECEHFIPDNIDGTGICTKWANEPTEPNGFCHKGERNHEPHRDATEAE